MKPLKSWEDEPVIYAVIAIILAAAALWAVGCGGGGAYSTPTTPSPAATTPPSTGSTSGANVTVAITGSVGSASFSPNPAPAASGQSVAFKNSDGTMHHLVADNGTWDSGDITPGATSRILAVTNTNALTFHCTIHPTMVGSINGSSAPPPPIQDPSGGYSYDYSH